MIINKRKRYLLAISLPLLILFAMPLLPISTYLLGEEILLKTKPYDPRDLFRGDYVVLNYEISDIEIEKLPKELTKTFKNGEYYTNHNKDIYVVLKKGSKYYEVDYASLKRPKKGIYLKGKIQSFTTNFEFVDETVAKELERTNAVEEVLSVVVDYSLDKYFIPENTGKSLEEASREGQLIAKVKVLNGYALLVDIFEEK